MNNDLQSIADDIIARTAKIAADLDAIEAGKKILAEATASADRPLTFTNVSGVVTTRRGSLGSSTPYLTVNEALLTVAKRNRLIRDGILVETVKTTPARNPAVSIRLSTNMSVAA